MTATNTFSSMKAILLTIFLIQISVFIAVSQVFSEIIGRPTPASVTISVLFDQDVEVYWEWGAISGNYPQSSAKFNLKKDVPFETDLTGLAANTAYFYRIRYRSAGSAAAFSSGAEHTFHTPRPAGSSFTFAIEADPHLDSNSLPEAYSQTLQNILAAKPDFLFDLGDTFMSEKEPNKNQSTITARHLLFRPYFGAVCHSVPLYLILGNHEGEVGWELNGTATNLAVMASNTRKLYYPNPLPNSFYSGNTKEEPFVGLRENYYSFEWGDALFVILDPYWYTINKPDWGWTLGPEQYNWFKKTITECKAKFKFVFCHNLVGGNTKDARGGAEYADLFEMGGKNSDGTSGWSSFRPGWEKPIHQLMVENKVTVFFHGHDHFFGKQEKDGVIYQEVPQPSNKNITNLQASEYGYVNGIFLPGRGYLKVSVSPENVQINYIRTYVPSEENSTRKNGEVAYSYTLKTAVTSIGKTENLPAAPDLEQNSPNPFQDKTTINYQIPKTGRVELDVFNLTGQKVSRLVNQTQAAGSYSVVFTPPRNEDCQGIYFCRLTVGNFSKSIKLLQSVSN
jgi:hypothetical protein